MNGRDLPTSREPGPSQELWPFGPAPTAACQKAAGHEWRIIDMYQACDPPMPSFECNHCGWLWTRGWTREEFRRVILRGAERDDYYGDGSDYPLEPSYAK